MFSLKGKPLFSRALDNDFAEMIEMVRGECSEDKVEIVEIKDNQILFRKRGRFPMSGTYNFTFEQAMRDKQLEGIKSVGIRIVKDENQ